MKHVSSIALSKIQLRLALGLLWLSAALATITLIVGCAANMGGYARQMAERSAAPGRDLVDASSLPSRDEELWVIEKPGARQSPARDDQTPGSGALVAKSPNDPQKTIPIPLKHTDVKASVAGYIATVDVTQQYHNPFSEKIEAMYIFPLPHNAAVNEFIMTIGERKIRGIIRERQEAQRIYNEARAQGYVASLLTQERPNIFTQLVANIEPGKAIDINIKFFHTLAYVDGWYEYVFPMVVGPRFNPPGSTDGVGAVGRGGRGASGQSTELQYLAPGERSGHDIALSVQIDAGVSIEKIESRNHKISVANRSPSVAQVTLASDDSIPNKDFVLRYKVAGKTLKSTIMVQKEEKGGYFTLILYPPESLNDLPRKPLEMVFTVDVSGSQTGEPFQQEKAATRYALTHMGPDDTFQVIRFSDTADRMAAKPVPATRDNVRKALDWLESPQFFLGNGTELAEGVRASLDFPHDESRLRFVAFLTDGFIGNESDALREIHNLLGPSRIFSFGVGSSTNRYLLDHMAKMGSGAVAYLGLHDSADDVMSQFFDRISHPALTDIAIDWGNLKVQDVFPQRIPDLFVGRPVILTGRFTGGGSAVIRVHGKVGSEMTQIDIPVNFDDPAATHKGITAVWARAKIADLADRAVYEPNNELPQQIKAVALEYGLLSQFTAFVAVDSTHRTAGDHGTSVAVPVPVPDGVRYDTTVQENPNTGAEK